MTAPVPVRGEVTFRLISPGVQGAVERTVTLELPSRSITAPEQLQRLNFESDCKFAADGWLSAIKGSRAELVAAIEAVAYTSAVLSEVLEVVK